jgi:hypothetical protein
MEHWGEGKWDWLKRILRLGPNWVPLVSAQVHADEDHHYYVSLQRHHPQVQPFEFVRLLLHYYARALFLFDPSDARMIQSARALIDLMRIIFSRRVDAECNVLQRAGIDGNMTLVSSEPQKKGRTISATLYYVSRDKLYLKVHIPKDASIEHVIYSVPALLERILPELDGRSVNVLNYALGKMNEAYKEGKSFSEVRHLSEVPVEAFQAAAQLFGQPPSPFMS